MTSPGRRRDESNKFNRVNTDKCDNKNTVKIEEFGNCNEKNILKDNNRNINSSDINENTVEKSKFDNKNPSKHEIINMSQQRKIYSKFNNLKNSVQDIKDQPLVPTNLQELKKPKLVKDLYSKMIPKNNSNPRNIRHKRLLINLSTNIDEVKPISHTILNLNKTIMETFQSNGESKIPKQPKLTPFTHGFYYTVQFVLILVCDITR